MVTWFKDWTVFEKLWLASFTLVNVYLFFAWGDSVLGLLTSLTGMMCVVLVAKGKISNYYFGFVNVVLYSYLAYQQGLMGEYQLNVFFYLPMQFIGFYLWNRARNKVIKGEVESVKVKVFKLHNWIVALTFATIGIFIYSSYLQSIESSQPYLDATTTVLAITAQILMAKRYAEQWLFWIAINILSIVLWTKAFLLTGNDVTMLAMWSAYLINSVYGYVNWLKLNRE